MTEISTEMIGVIDTAVKVGLGALISVAGAIAIALFNNSRTLKMERLSRRRELIESIIQELQEFTNSALSYWSSMSHFIDCKGEDDKETKALETLKEQRANLNKNSSSFTSAQAKLFLLGDHKANELLRKYAGVIEDFVVEIDINDESLNQEVLNKRRTLIKVSRTKAFDRISELYNDLNVGM